MTDISRDSKDRRVTAEFDVRTLRFNPKSCLITVYQLHLDPARRILASQSLGDRLAKQRAIGRFYEVRDFATDQLVRLQSDKTRCRLIGQQDFFVMDYDNLGQRSGEILEQPVPALYFFVAFAQCIKQSINGLR